MGSAAVECVGGCACGRSTFDATWERRATLTQMHEFQVLHILTPSRLRSLAGWCDLNEMSHWLVFNGHVRRRGQIRHQGC